MTEDEQPIHPTPPPSHFTRRTFLADGASAVAAASVIGQLTGGKRVPRLARAPQMYQARAAELEALRVLGRSSMRMPGSLPNEAIAAGTDTLPQIEHVVVLMMENHSYDNFFGMLGRQPGQRPRGDGLRIGYDGYPVNHNPQANGKPLRAF